MNSPEQLQRSSSSVHLVFSNDDLITEILLRLPPKSVIRSKLVSKKWLSLISDPHFVISHSHLNPNVISGLFFTGSKYIFKFPPWYLYISLTEHDDGDDEQGKAHMFVPSDTLRFTYILQSCNGLLLYSTTNFFQTEKKYYILNPTTKKFTTLPLTHQMCQHHFQLAFDPSISSHYRVVYVGLKIVLARSQEIITIHIYSSKTRTWKVSGNYNLEPSSVAFNNGVYWNGAIHWISPLGQSLRFDVDKECLYTMPMPPLPEDWDTKNFKYFGTTRGHLHLIGLKNLGFLQFIVFEMERDCSRWLIKYNLDLSGILTPFPEIIGHQALHPLSVVTDHITILSLIRGENENEEGTTLMMYILNMAITYNLKDNTFKKLTDFSNSVRLECRFHKAFEYIETLSSV